MVILYDKARSRDQNTKNSHNEKQQRQKLSYIHHQALYRRVDIGIHVITIIIALLLLNCGSLTTWAGLYRNTIIISGLQSAEERQVTVRPAVCPLETREPGEQARQSQARIAGIELIEKQRVSECSIQFYLYSILSHSASQKMMIVQY